MNGPGSAGSAESPPLTLALERTLEPTARRLRIKDLPHHRRVLGVLAVRDFKVKFKQSVAGPLWILVQPVALLAAFAVGFGGVIDVPSNIPYALFVLVALCVWLFFSISFNMGAVALVTNYYLVRRTPCPRAALPLASLLTNLPALAIPLVAALTYAAILGYLSPRIVLLPVGLVWLFAVTGSAVLLVGGVAARYRDAAQAVPFLLQLGIFAAPIGYSLDSLGSATRVLISLNPLTGVIEFWRWMFLQPYDLPVDVVLIGLGSSVILVVAAWRLFGRLETTMADYI